jgi:hypothetical protein
MALRHANPTFGWRRPDVPHVRPPQCARGTQPTVCRGRRRAGAMLETHARQNTRRGRPAAPLGAVRVRLGPDSLRQADHAEDCLKADRRRARGSLFCLVVVRDQRPHRATLGQWLPPLGLRGRHRRRRGPAPRRADGTVQRQVVDAGRSDHLGRPRPAQAWADER